MSLCTVTIRCVMALSISSFGLLCCGLMILPSLSCMYYSHFVAYMFGATSSREVSVWLSNVTKLSSAHGIIYAISLSSMLAVVCLLIQIRITTRSLLPKDVRQNFSSLTMCSHLVLQSEMLAALAPATLNLAVANMYADRVWMLQTTFEKTKRVILCFLTVKPWVRNVLFALLFLSLCSPMLIIIAPGMSSVPLSPDQRSSSTMTSSGSTASVNTERPRPTAPSANIARPEQLSTEIPSRWNREVEHPTDPTRSITGAAKAASLANKVLSITYDSATWVLRKSFSLIHVMGDSAPQILPIWRKPNQSLASLILEFIRMLASMFSQLAYIVMQYLCQSLILLLSLLVTALEMVATLVMSGVSFLRSLLPAPTSLQLWKPSFGSRAFNQIGWDFIWLRTIICPLVTPYFSPPGGCFITGAPSTSCRGWECVPSEPY